MAHIADINSVDEAVELLHQLLDEDENEVEIWYVLACAHMAAAAAAGDDNTDQTEPLRIASECVTHALDLIRRQPEDAQWSEPLRNLGVELDRRKEKQGISGDTPYNIQSSLAQFCSPIEVLYNLIVDRQPRQGLHGAR
mmetsp:Transcript_6328/g.5394  ORF Transcript_6328/g.5394 Transcript_6328/m.5394 type:complete len:139 (+) Transcript_6328:73-489(+)